MKRKVLKPWVEKAITIITVINAGLLVSINDFNLAAIPILLLMLFVVACGMFILSEYGRAK